MTPLPSAGPSRILLIRPSALGDVCRSVPVLASLRARYPQARIDWLVQDVFVDAVRHHPMLVEHGGDAIPFERRALSQSLKRGRVKPLLAFLRSLRQARYDLVLDCQGLGRSGFFTWATRAARRVGDRDARELGWIGYNERYRIDPPPQRLHAVDRMLALVESAGVAPVRDMRLYTSPTDRDWLLSDLRLRPAQFAVVAPTSRWPGKRWPADRFAAVARAMLERGQCVAVVGGASERDQCEPLLELAKSDTRVVDLVGKTSVGQLMAVIEASTFVIANDSAALHMAVGFDRPYVALYGPTRVDLVGPYTGPRSPAGLHSGVVLQHVQPGDVFDHKHDDPGRMMMRRIPEREAIEAMRSLVN